MPPLRGEKHPTGQEQFISTALPLILTILPVLEQVAGFTVTILAGDHDGDGKVGVLDD